MKRALLLGLTSLGLSIANAEINVVAIYEGQAAFVMAARQSDNPDLKALATEHIVRPYLDVCSRGVSAEVRAENAAAMETPVSDIRALNASVQELKRREIAENVKTYLLKASEILPLAADRDVTVCIEAWDPARVPDQPFVEEVVKGVAGQHLGNGTIWLSIHPYPGWFEQAKYTAPHEYHHAVRDAPDTGTLLEAMVDEGLADAFIRQLYGGWTPHSFAATEFLGEIEQRVWLEVLPHLHNSDEDIVSRYLYGSVYGADDLPPIPGYTFGRYIAYKFLENAPATPVKEWTHLPADQIFEVSGYQGNFGGLREAEE